MSQPTLSQVELAADCLTSYQSFSYTGTLFFNNGTHFGVKGDFADAADFEGDLRSTYTSSSQTLKQKRGQAHLGFIEEDLSFIRQ